MKTEISQKKLLEKESWKLELWEDSYEECNQLSK